MDQKEFKHWQAVTATSAHQWVEDPIVRLNGRGAIYYTGGEDGFYMKLSPEGRITLGAYKGAFPHIGEAVFKEKASRDCGSFDAAFQLTCQLGGKQFLADIFSNHQIPQETVQTTLVPDVPED